MFSKFLKRPVVQFIDYGIGCLIPAGFAADSDGRVQIAPPDRACFILIGNIRDFPKGHIPSVPHMDREGRKIGQPRRIASFQPEADRHELISLIGFRHFIA